MARVQRRVGVWTWLGSGVGMATLAGARPMSTDAGGKVVADRILAEAKALVDAAAAEEEQLDLLDPVTAEEMAYAQEELGPRAGNLAVLRHAREKRRGRPRGAKNRRSDDFERYISQFGPDPAVVLAQIAGTPEEVMIERSKQLDPDKRRLTYGEARAMRIRCAEALMPFRHSKKPVAVDATIRGVMVVEEIGGAARGVTIEADPLGVLPYDEEAGE